MECDEKNLKSLTIMNYLAKQQKLSRRETQILKLIILEYTTPEIAGKLYVSKDTIKSHRKNLLRKLSARNVAGLVRRAFEIELVKTRAEKVIVSANPQ